MNKEQSNRSKKSVFVIIVTIALIIGFSTYRFIRSTHAFKHTNTQQHTHKVIIKKVTTNLTLVTDKGETITLSGVQFDKALNDTTLYTQALNYLKKTLNKECLFEPESRAKGYIYTDTKNPSPKSSLNARLIHLGIAEAKSNHKHRYSLLFADIGTTTPSNPKKEEPDLTKTYSNLSEENKEKAKRYIQTLANSQNDNEVNNKTPNKKAPQISPLQAHLYYGKEVSVKGRVVATHNTGKVCFLNFDEDYKKSFTAVIFSRAFDAFPPFPEEHYLNKQVIITGRVKQYKNKPEIILNYPSQIKIID